MFEAPSLNNVLRRQGIKPGRFIADRYHRLSILDVAEKTNLDRQTHLLRGRSILLANLDQLATVLALVQLDGVAKRIVICTPDLPPDYLRQAFDDAALDTVVTDGKRFPALLFNDVPNILCSNRLEHTSDAVERTTKTEWLLFTSGTTGRPKLVLHTVKTLMSAFDDGVGAGEPPLWSTFYDIRRYGGLQVLLRALAGSGSMVLSDPSEPLGDFLRRAGDAGVTHISGTPSHWRRVLMSITAPHISPHYIRLSGEPADQATLDRLRRAYAGAEVAHAFATTEAGVAFDVRDGRAGFPASLLMTDGPVSLRIDDGSLCIRSSRTAHCYVGSDVPDLLSADGYFNTGDILQRHDDRYLFMGRRNDIINVGGLKVHPEAVELVINQHPAVRMSRVTGRPNSITGAIVIAEIVLGSGSLDINLVREEIVDLCRSHLARHQVPSALRVVPSLPVGASGKLLRRHA
jgi:acyl-coenzyme A synthetase/AMP-(fatty) acid ligase